VLNRTAVYTHLDNSIWNKLFVEFEHGELRRVENLITELPVSLYSENLQVDITTLQGGSD
jgi:hypothetical protein